ncbi:MAG: DUF1501 domain-containing protein, partial [Janthinobacterium lividum]
ELLPPVRREHVTPSLQTDLEPCGCPEGVRAGSVSRRSLLAAAGALGAVATLPGLSGPDFSTSLAFAGTRYTGDTLVVLSLRGGCDGLSFVPPVGDPDYYAARPNIAVPASRALRLDPMFGLHPALKPLKPIWDAGQLAVVHAVGQQNPTRSHFAAMEQMENAAPGSHLRTGWLDRMIGAGEPAETFSSVAVGSAAAPASMMGPSPELSMLSVDEFKLAAARDKGDSQRWTTLLSALYRRAPAVLSAPMTATVHALSATAQPAADEPANGAHYPDSGAGLALRDVARLIRSGLGLRAATVDVGDWDMHAGLGRSDAGWMFDRLTDLGQALAAFWTDLGPRSDRVSLVTLSEFGRRVAENASGGLDHGLGNVSLVMGGGISGGQVYGRWPGLGRTDLVGGDLAGVTDYRTILAELLEKRTGVSTSSVFPGLDPGRLGLARAR